MKKILCLSVCCLLAACQGGMMSLPTGEQLKTCLTNEALARIQDGSALAAPVRTTAKKMLNACLLPEEQTPESNVLAQTILTALMQEKES